MAFGKDPALLHNLANFHQKTATLSQRTEKRATRGGMRFANMYRPSESFVDTIRLIPGDYTTKWVDSHGSVNEEHLGFFLFAEHFDGRRKKGAICSAGPFANFKDKADPCLGCQRFWAEVRARVAQKRYSKRDMYAFNVFDYGIYYEIPQVDRQTGQARLKDDKTPWTEWVKGTGRNDLAKAQMPSKDGHLCHWAMGHGHYTSLMAANEMIGDGCRSCGKKMVDGKPAIRSCAWICSNTECGEALIDLDETEMNFDEIVKVTRRPMTCRRCRHTTLAQEVIECRSCAKPERASIFDVDLNVRRVKPQADSNQTNLMVTGWSDPAPMRENAAKAAEKLYDLEKMYAPSSMEEQERMFGPDDDGPAPTDRPYTPAASGRYNG